MACPLIHSGGPLSKEAPLPRGVPTSRTGRVPQWVLDEALGKPVTPAPWRASPTGPTGPRRRRKAIRFAWGAAAGVVLLGVGMLGPQVGPLPESQLQLQPPKEQVPSERGPQLGFEEESAPLGTPPGNPSQTERPGFRYSRHQPEERSRPVTWSPCRPVHYVTRLDNSPLWGRAVITESLAQVSQATGLVFVDDGVTDEGPSEDRQAFQPARYGDRWAPVLIAWATRAEVPDFGVDIVGEAGPVTVRTASGDDAHVSGTVYLDPVTLGQMHGQHGQAVAKSVVLHELGHLVGLAHVDSTADLMFPRAQVSSVDFGAGDRAGLAALGSGDCQPDA